MGAAGRLVVVRITRRLHATIARRAAVAGLTPDEWMTLALEAPHLAASDDGARRRTAIRAVQARRRHGLGSRRRV